MERVGELFSRQQSLTAGVRLWQRRVRHVSSTYGTVSDFQVQRAVAFMYCSWYHTLEPVSPL